MSENMVRHLGNYRLLRPLGRGSFADVYLAEHIYLQTQAAIKLVRVQLGDSTLDNFLAEARTIARLRHPNIVGLLEFGLQKETGTPFLAMEYAPNGTLRHRHPRGTRLPISLVLSYLRQVTAGLQYAHDEKFIHRDIKPENLLLGADNEVLVSDFGIALIAQTSYQNRSDVAGTMTYMAPEQLLGRPQLASDQYALATIIYEWLSGSPPFSGSFAALANQHLNIPPPSLSLSISDIPPAVEQVIMKALAKDPGQRFPSVQSFADAFEQACLAGPYGAALASLASAPTLSPAALAATLAAPSFPGVDLQNQPTVLDADLQTRRLRLKPITILSLVVIALVVMTGSGWLYFTKFAPSARHVPPPVQGSVSTTTQLYLNATTGSSIMNDSLAQNSTSNWIEASLPTGGGCSFRNGAYYALTLQAGLVPCLAQGTDFNDFAFQVQMTIERGDQGGLLFRSDAISSEKYPGGTNYYLFTITTDGRYHLSYQGDKLIELLGGVGTAIKTGTGQSNQLTVIAQGDLLSLYVNGTYLASINDSHRTSGLVGVFAQQTNSETEVAFQNARAWGL